ncbi:MAG: CAP domain-containing protein [Oscillospiraceae bacterium]
MGEIFNIDYSSDISVKMFGLNWQSSNYDIAIVNQYGTVTARGPGHVQISVSCGNLEPQVCDIFITEADEAEDLSEMTINFNIRTLNLTVGDKLSVSDLGYSVEPEEYADKVMVVSMNPQLIEISNNTIIAKAYGKADIMVYVPNGQHFTITTYIQKNETDAAADRIAFAEEIVACLNVERAKYDLDPLTLDIDLCELAQIRAEECKISYSHTRPDGTKWSTVFAGTAYEKLYRGENLIKTAGYCNAQELVDIWMSSPSHASNILNPRFTSVGVGAILGINTSSTEKIAYISALLFVNN